MKITLKSVKISNFKGIKELIVDFGEKTSILGANATGKSSIFDAVTWLLFNKSSLGVEKFDLRPLDADGNPIHYIEISVAGAFVIDGKEVELSKTQKENWVKSRGEEKAEFKGNVNEYCVDGFPKSERDYKAVVNEMVSEDLFKMLSNPLFFPNMKWKEQRDILMRLASQETDVEIAKRIGGFDELIPDLEKAPSTDDIRVKYTKALKELKGTQAEIPVRIDEISKQKVDIDVSALELQKKALEEELAGLVTPNNNDAIKDVNDKLLALEFEINEVIRKANEGIVKDRMAVDNKVYALNNEITTVCRELDNMSDNAKRNADEIDRITKFLTSMGEEYKAEKAKEFPAEKWVFDENSTICSMCGQKLPESKIEALKKDFADRKAQAVASFEKEKNAKLKDLIDKGNYLKEKKESFTKSSEDIKARIEEGQKKQSELEKEMSVYLQKQKDMPKEADLSENAEYKALIEQKTALEAKKEELKTAPAPVDRKVIAEQELSKVNEDIAKAMANSNIDERIAELQTELKEVAQKIADSEKMLYLFENFVKAKLDNISANINGHFRMAKWKLFDTQINGGIAECCEATYNGVPFSDLNRGHQILVGMDICRTLSEIYESNVFMFVDNAEAVNDFNMPDTENQLILLKVADDKELKVVEK